MSNQTDSRPQDSFSNTNQIKATALLSRFSRLKTFFFVLLLSFSIFSVALPESAEAQGNNNVTIETICVNINAGWPDPRAVYAQILAILQQGLQALLQVGVGVGIGNVQACLPNINLNIPNLDLAACFNVNLE